MSTDTGKILAEALRPAVDAVEDALGELRGATAAAPVEQTRRRLLRAHYFAGLALRNILRAHEHPSYTDAWTTSRKAAEHLYAARNLLHPGHAPSPEELAFDNQFEKVVGAIGHLETVSTRVRENGAIKFEDGWLTEIARAARASSAVQDGRLGVYDPRTGNWRLLSEPRPLPGGPRGEDDIERLEAYEGVLRELHSQANNGDNSALKERIGMIALGKPLDIWMAELPEWATPVYIARGKTASLLSHQIRGYLHVNNPELLSKSEAEAAAIERAQATGVAHGVYGAGLYYSAVGPLEVRTPHLYTFRGNSVEVPDASASAALAGRERVIWTDSKLRAVAVPSGEVHGLTPLPQPYLGQVSPRRTLIS